MIAADAVTVSELNRRREPIASLAGPSLMTACASPTARSPAPATRSSLARTTGGSPPARAG